MSIYDCMVDWGDGSPIDHIASKTDPKWNHTYATAGNYDIKITGTCPAPKFTWEHYSDDYQLIDIKQWGHVIEMTNWSSAFVECSGLGNISATDSPTLIGPVTDMFRDIFNFNANIDHWNVSQVTDMEGMFFNNSKFTSPLNSWDVSNVTSMAAMFNGATLFNSPLNNWNVSNVTDMFIMFVNAENFNQNLSCWNVAHIPTEPFDFKMNSALTSQNTPQWGVVDPCCILVDYEFNPICTTVNYAFDQAEEIIPDPDPIFECPNGSVWETFKMVTL